MKVTLRTQHWKDRDNVNMRKTKIFRIYLSIRFCFNDFNLKYTFALALEGREDSSGLERKLPRKFSKPLPLIKNKKRRETRHGKEKYQKKIKMFKYS